jgi:hypothetical protein
MARRSPPDGGPLSSSTRPASRTTCSEVAPRPAGDALHDGQRMDQQPPFQPYSPDVGCGGPRTHSAQRLVAAIGPRSGEPALLLPPQATIRRSACPVHQAGEGTRGLRPQRRGRWRRRSRGRVVAARTRAGVMPLKASIPPRDQSARPRPYGPGRTAMVDRGGRAASSTVLLKTPVGAVHPTSASMNSVDREPSSALSRDGSDQARAWACRTVAPATLPRTEIPAMTGGS